MGIFLIGMDDTDNATTPGTGRLARHVAAEIERWGGRYLGCTGHQFLIDPRVPYTGHNRGICVAAEWLESPDALDLVFDMVAQGSAPGSDPGVCIAPVEAVGMPIIAWGERAMREVLTMDEAVDHARTAAIQLRPLGGTGGGIIGALASVGLRASGEHGRFVDLPGLRALGSETSARALSAMGIVVEYLPPAGAAADAPLPANGTHKTLGWVRPRLSGGRPVLRMEWSDDEHAWIPCDRKAVDSENPR